MLSKLYKTIFAFLSRRFAFLLRLIIGIFMLMMGTWLVLAPITQEFFSKQETLQDAPYLWLIVPLGLLQISIGIGILRPLFK